MKTEVKPKINKEVNFAINMSRCSSSTLKNKYQLKEVKKMTLTSDFYWNIFQTTGSPVAYLLYKEETSSN